MKESMLVITPDNEIKTYEYCGYESIKRKLNGNFNYFSSSNISVMPTLANGNFVLLVDFICGSDVQYERLNAFGTLISGKEIRGDVIVLASEKDGSNRGFKYKEELIDGVLKESFCESWTVKDTLTNFIKNNKSKLTFLRTSLDETKTELENSHELCFA